jgi:ferredoxin-NADP reductase
MAALRGKLAAREQVAEATWAFHFETPETLDYRAGQSADVTLIAPPFTDAGGNKRPFSLASAPGGNRLMIVSRVRGSAFKQSLVEGPLGLAVEIDGPFGSMTLPEAPAPVVMLAGGIGVTPFRAIAEDAIRRKLGHALTLVHSNRTPGDAPFLAELQRWSAASPSFRYVPTMTGDAPKLGGWSGERLRLDVDTLARLVPDYRDVPHWLLAGPDRFIQGVGLALTSMGVPMQRMAMEQFSGY